MAVIRRTTVPLESQKSQRVWKVLRGPLRSGCSVAQLVAATSCSPNYVADFMLVLLRCGYVTRVQGVERTWTYVLRKDTGLHVPRIRFSGTRRCGLYDPNLKKDVDFLPTGGSGTRHATTKVAHARAASITLAWEPGDFDAGC